MRNNALTYGEILDNEINNKGIVQLRSDISASGLEALYYKNANDNPAIVIDKNITASKHLNSIKVHELINHKYCKCDMFHAPKRLQQEYTAICRRQEVFKAMPLELLVKAVVKYDCSNNYELSEFFEIPEEDVIFGLEEYAKIYGLSAAIGKYIVYWNPFRVEKKEGKS